jgi:23S rRNA (adenine2503-C2)-methyltransferase
MLEFVRARHFSNGSVYALKTEDGYLVETTDTCLPSYTKDAISHNTNALRNYKLGDRRQRWMIGVSTMSGCGCRCKFCATGNMKKFRNLTVDEIIAQVQFILDKNVQNNPADSFEFKINYTRMGEPFLNIDNVRRAVDKISALYPNTHHYISTIGINGSDFSWIKGNITLQVSLHSLDENRRNNLIPFKNKMKIAELGQIRTQSNLKTTVNLTLVDKNDFNIAELKKYFDPQYFFIKLSPINPNKTSDKNGLGLGIIEQC